MATPLKAPQARFLSVKEVRLDAGETFLEKAIATAIEEAYADCASHMDPKMNRTLRDYSVFSLEGKLHVAVTV